MTPNGPGASHLVGVQQLAAGTAEGDSVVVAGAVVAGADVTPAGSTLAAVDQGGSDLRVRAALELLAAQSQAPAAQATQTFEEVYRHLSEALTRAQN